MKTKYQCRVVATDGSIQPVVVSLNEKDYAPEDLGSAIHDEVSDQLEAIGLNVQKITWKKF